MHIACRGCRNPISVTPDDIGHSVQCPKCRRVNGVEQTAAGSTLSEQQVLDLLVKIRKYTANTSMNTFMIGIILLAFAAVQLIVWAIQFMNALYGQQVVFPITT